MTNKNKKSPNGVYHPLGNYYDELNKTYFDYTINATIAWAPNKGAISGSRKSIRLGTYNLDKKHISIHRCLDQAFVPKPCVLSVIFHEMLHQKHGYSLSKTGKHLFHTTQFRREEKLFKHNELTEKWFKLNLHVLLNFKPFFLNNYDKYLDEKPIRLHRYFQAK